MTSRDTSQPAPTWQCLPTGGWVRQPPRGSVVTALVRRDAGRFVMRVGGGPWLPAGDTLLAATEHAGGHAAAAELRAAIGEDRTGPCAQCARLAATAAKESGR